VKHQDGEHIDQAFSAKQRGHQRDADQYVVRVGGRKAKRSGAPGAAVSDQIDQQEHQQHRYEIGQQQHWRHAVTQLGAGDPGKQHCRHE